MGAHDRDYMRDDSTGSGIAGLFSSTWKGVIVVTVLCYLLQIFIPGESSVDKFGLERLSPEEQAVALEMAPRPSLMEEWFVLDPDKVFGGQVWRLLTYGFLHDRLGLLHILINMLLLFWFGRRLETLYGSREFLWFYLSGIVIASLAHIALGLATSISSPALGASGGVMAVFMLFAMHYPREKILLFFVLPIEIRWLLLVYVLFDLHPVLLALSGQEVGDGVAHAAHLGGLAFGYFYYRSGKRLTDLFAKGQPKRKKKKPSKPSKLPAQKKGDPLSDEVDRILEKINEEGLHSLTPKERKILEDGSKRM